MALLWNLPPLTLAFCLCVHEIGLTGLATLLEKTSIICVWFFWPIERLFLRLSLGDWTLVSAFFLLVIVYDAFLSRRAPNWEWEFFYVFSVDYSSPYIFVKVSVLFLSRLSNGTLSMVYFKDFCDDEGCWSLFSSNEFSSIINSEKEALFLRLGTRYVLFWLLNVDSLPGTIYVILFTLEECLMKLCESGVKHSGALTALIESI